MERLGVRDLRVLLDFLREVYALQNLNGFLRHVISQLPTVVPSESTSYNEVNVRMQQNALLTDPPDAFTFPDHRRIFERHIPEHPLIAHYGKTGDVRALKISDFLSRSQFHRLGLYNEFFARVDVEYLIGFTLRIRRPLVIGIALTRSRPDFSERDRLCLDLLRPHLVQAYGNAEATSRMQGELELARHLVEVPDRGLIVLASHGRVRMTTARARQRLSEYFGSPSRLGHRLPESLDRWVSHEEALLARRDDVPRSREPLVLERGGKRLVVRLLPDAGQMLLLLEERAGVPRPQVLEHLGLSRREAEVLAWLAEGKTNTEIGSILGTSPRTVAKHLEHVYQKLGVETRTAAARLVLSTPPEAA